MDRRHTKRVREKNYKSILNESSAQRQIHVDTREKPYALQYAEMMANSKITATPKRCPFCGGKVEIIEKVDRSYIECPECTGRYYWAKAECPEDNLKAWNRRVR